MSTAQLEAERVGLELETYRWLRDMARWCAADECFPLDEYGERRLDVRLQVFEDGAYVHHSGDASYDTDHRGFWGASVVSWDDGESVLMETARDMVGQVLDACAQSEA